MAEENQLQKEAKMMKLEKLIRERETVEMTPFPIPDDELLARYEKLYAGCVSDVLREFCYLDQALPCEIHPLRDSDVVAGFAFTVKSAPCCKITGEMSYRGQMLDEMGKNHFVLWDTSGDVDATLWGGVMTATAYGKGVKAAAIDGNIRDTKQILEKPFPIFYKHRMPNGSLSRCQITHYQIPIKIGKCFIKPGDVVFGDIDGVVVIPRAVAYDVLLRHGRNWRIKLIETEDHFSAETVANAMKDGVDGFILFQKLSRDLWKKLIESKIPIVSMESVCPKEVKRGRYVHLVHMDDEGIGTLAAEHLLSAGDFRSFGFVPTFLKETWSIRRLKGFATAIRREGKRCHVFTPSKDATLDNESALIKWLGSLPSPCAIFAVNDLIATRVLAACNGANLSVPRQVAILGVDDDEILCLNAEPTLSSIHYVTAQEGELIAAHLEKMMMRQPTDSNLLTWNYKQVVPRESTSFTTPAAQLIRRALLHIDRFATEGLKARDVAQELGVSQRLLELRFRELENRTVVQAIDERRFAELTRLLRNTKAPITHIAQRSGFGNLPSLTRRFRQLYGMTMKEWRAQKQVGRSKKR